MVDWAEKNADVTKLHTLMGAVGQKLCTEKELATHKATAGRLNAPIRADFIALTDAQITADYNNPEKMHLALTAESQHFQNISQVARQRLVYKILKNEMESCIHALKFVELTP